MFFFFSRRKEMWLNVKLMRLERSPTVFSSSSLGFYVLLRNSKVLISDKYANMNSIERLKIAILMNLKQLYTVCCLPLTNMLLYYSDNVYI